MINVLSGWKTYLAARRPRRSGRLSSVTEGLHDGLHDVPRHPRCREYPVRDCSSQVTWKLDPAELPHERQGQRDSLATSQGARIPSGPVAWIDFADGVEIPPLASPVHAAGSGFSRDDPVTMTPSLLGPPPAVSTEAATLEFPEYIVKHGKIPMLGDDPPPWAYRGWLLHYVQLADFAINKENSRWAYMLEMFETGQMPEQPIPQIKFGEPDCQISRSSEIGRL